MAPIKKPSHEYLPALLLLIASVLAVAAGTAFPPADARQVAVVFAPTAEPVEIAAAVAASGSLLVRAGAFDNIVVVELAEDSHHSALYGHGAWLVLDPIAAGGCAVGPNQQSRLKISTSRSEYHEPAG